MELQVKNGLFRYGHRDPVLKGVGFRFGDGTGSGRILAVLGPNGAGKTTLIRLLLGHLRWTEGETLFGGRKAASLSPAELARLIGYVPQAKVPPFAVTVLEMTELGRIAFHGEFGEPEETDEAAALEALDTVGIRHLAGRLCSEISGGEYQLALFARALAAGPGLLLLDEPEAGLDFRNQRRILSTLKSLRGKGVSSVFITHYPDHALELADDALLLGKGKAPVFGRASDVLTEESLSEAFGIQVRIRDVQIPEGIRKTVIAAE